MYRGRSIYTRLAMESILEGLGARRDYRGEYPDEELTVRKACFVSLHMKNGELRGCIGTLSSYRESLMEEIIENAKAAAFRDPRFPPLSPREAEEVEISVDVLEEAERIGDETLLDPKIYGVIVECGARRGVLLPDLPGIDSAEDQLRIAMSKGGISPGEEVELYRFRVRRYH